MRLEIIKPGFSTADTSYPELASAAGALTVQFRSSSGAPVRVKFQDVPTFSWEENDDLLLPGEPWDGVCELFDSPLLMAYSLGLTLHSVAGLRHIRLNFNAWGRLDVLCTNIVVAA